MQSGNQSHDDGMYDEPAILHVQKIACQSFWSSSCMWWKWERSGPVFLLTNINYDNYPPFPMSDPSSILILAMKTSWIASLRVSSEQLGKPGSAGLSHARAEIIRISISHVVVLFQLITILQHIKIINYTLENQSLNAHGHHPTQFGKIEKSLQNREYVEIPPLTILARYEEKMQKFATCGHSGL